MTFEAANELCPAYTSPCEYIRRRELYMINTPHRLHQNQTRIARVLLVLFVMAWVNLVFQAPVHAAMKMNHDMPCHCTHTLCDTVLAMEEQADDGLASSLPMLADMTVLFQLLPVIPASSVIDRHFQLAELTFHNTSPLPLARTGILRI
jgi:hypothetical protein